MTIDTSPPPPLPPRPRAAHKGRFGHVLVLGGSEGMAGAVVLCARAALRGGAGLVTAACPRSVYPFVASQLVSAMTWPLEGAHFDPAAARAVLGAFETRRFDVLAIGPGLGREPATAEAVASVLEGLDAPWVADADALNALASRRGVLERTAHPGVLTPHPGEMARLVARPTAEIARARAAAARNFAAAHPRHVLVLKGAGTLVAHGERLWRCDAGNPGLATGGTGDVLTGLIGALLGQGLEPFEAARLGVWLHAHAGDLAAARLGEVSLVASDVVASLPRAFVEHARAASR